MVYRLSLEKYVEPAKYVGFGAGVISIAMLPLIVLSQKQSLLAGNFYVAGKAEMTFMWIFITLHSVAILKLVHSLPQRIYFR